MYCAISGVIPEDAVVCTKSGHLYDRKLIENHIQLTGKDPVTGVEISTADLLAVKANKITLPRPTTSTSIPGLLGSLHSEWEGLMLETFNLRSQLETTRQELSQALYQHDAACRVIARLKRERDAARSALTSMQTAISSRGGLSSGGEGGKVGGGADDESMSNSASSSSSSSSGGAPSSKYLPEPQLSSFMEKSKELSKARKEKAKEATRLKKEGVAAPEVAIAASLQRASESASFTPHSASPAGITALACSASSVSLGGRGSGAFSGTAASSSSSSSSSSAGSTASDLLLTGGMDGAVLLYDASASGRIVARAGTVTAPAHTKRVTGVAFHPHRDIFASSSLDSTVKVWAPSNTSSGSYAASMTVRPHGKEGGGIVSLSIHPNGDGLCTVATDGTIAVTDVNTAAVLLRFSTASTAGGASTHCGGVHPDGLLLGCGASDGCVRMYDMREIGEAPAALLQSKGTSAAVRSLAFSENGFYAASGSADGGVRVWDLRNTEAPIRLLSIPAAAIAYGSVVEEASVLATLAAGASSASPISALTLDESGTFLTAGSERGALSIFNTKDWSAVLHLPTAAADSITGLRFGATQTKSFYATSMDRTLRRFNRA